MRLGSFGSVNAVGYSVIYMNVEAVGGQQNPGGFSFILNLYLVEMQHNYHCSKSHQCLPTRYESFKALASFFDAVSLPPPRANIYLF